MGRAEARPTIARSIAKSRRGRFRDFAAIVASRRSQAGIRYYKYSAIIQLDASLDPCRHEARVRVSSRAFAMLCGTRDAFFPASPQKMSKQRMTNDPSRSSRRDRKMCCCCSSDMEKGS